MPAESIDLGICYSPIMAIELNPRVIAWWQGLTEGGSPKQSADRDAEREPISLKNERT